MGHICLLQTCQTIHRWILLQYFYRAFVPYRGYLVEFPMSGCPQSLLPHSGPIRLLLCSCAQARRTSTGTLCSELHPLCTPWIYSHTCSTAHYPLPSKGEPFSTATLIVPSCAPLSYLVPQYIPSQNCSNTTCSVPEKKVFKNTPFFSFLSSLLKVLR